MSRTKEIAKPEDMRKDWSPASVVAGLWDRGHTLRKLSLANGYKGCSLAAALRRQWPAAEKIIARALGVPATEIWPSRYSTARGEMPARRKAAGR